ncbi:hypothetical protein ANCCAN_24684 [Ancylostoma caninum]|uniref:Uncharacterized protein n=1 Tax=Ancylostoma caninum TaxID=29170 RepID=A0A368FHA0_ANCCA|nr:hypothetical protein ANCCAN_24684 [Ancylostoma caninum]
MKDITLTPDDLTEIRIDSVDPPIKTRAFKSHSLPEAKRSPYRRESKIEMFKNSVRRGFKGSLRRLESYAGRVAKPANHYIRWNLLFTFLIFFFISSSIWIPAIPALNERQSTVWQSPLFYCINLHKSPFFVRVTGLLRAFFMMGYLIPWNINTMSIFSLTLPLLEAGEYTHPGYQVFTSRIRVQNAFAT